MMKAETLTFNVKSFRGVEMVAEVEITRMGWNVTHLDIAGMGRYPVISMSVTDGKALHKAGMHDVPADGTLYQLYKFLKDGKEFTTVLHPETSRKMGQGAQAARAARKEQYQQEWQKEAVTAQAALEAKIPGITALHEAHEAEAAYRAEFSRAMAAEDRDGVAMPARPQANIAALEEKYPRAALYIKADDYSSAMHDQKAAAGEKAKQMLEEGAALDAVEAVLNRWLPESAMLD
jgi:hypothetical protein